MRRLIPILILLLILSAALYAIFGGYGNNAGNGDNATNYQQQDVAALSAQYAVDDMQGFVFAPELKPALQNQFLGPDERSYALGSFKGKVLLVNFWATWCAPCRHEMPSLNAVQKARQKDGIEVVTISIDRGDGSKATRFMQDVGATDLTVYREPSNRMAGAFQVIAMPTTFLIDREGRVIGKFLGATEWNSPAAHALLDWALAN